MRILVADDQEDRTWGIRQCLIEQENQRYLYEIREVHKNPSYFQGHTIRYVDKPFDVED